MSDYKEQVVSGHFPALDWLEPLNRLGRETGRDAVLPNLRTEGWRYTSLRALNEGGFAAAGQAPGAELGESGGQIALEGLEGYPLVFANGHYCAELSAAGDLPEGVTAVPFSRATETERERIREQLGSQADRQGRIFTALNDSVLAEGLFVRVAANVRLEKPLHVVWLTSPQGEAFTVAQRMVVVLEQGSEASVVEHFASSDEAQNVFTNGVTEISVAENARLNHYRLHLEDRSALHVGAVYASLARSATLKGFHLALGGRLKRNDVVVRLRGEGAHCELNGVYLPRNNDVIDYHTTMEHEAPHCTSEETFRGIVADDARAVFNGRIHIHRGAQKTSAHLSNRNLLTSNRAEVDTKPELEIYADDVQCSHGATVSQLDYQQVHYLRTRGISEQEARVLLSFGFINEILNRIASKPLHDYLRPKLARLFARDPKLMRHLL